MVKTSETIDADIIITGDWNEKPSSQSWSSIHDLENKGELRFSTINSESSISHLYYKNKKNLGSRLDLAAISIAAYDEVAGDPQVVRWANLDDFLNSSPKAREIKSFLKEIREDISDHMPVVTRFYFDERSA
jgi:exonuclease III